MKTPAVKAGVSILCLQTSFSVYMAPPPFVRPARNGLESVRRDPPRSPLQYRINYQTPMGRVKPASIMKLEGRQFRQFVQGVAKPPAEIIRP